jgi:hypothetical protein
MKRMLLLFAVLALLAPLPACAKSAEVMLFPTRVILDNNQHFARIIVKNAGDAAGDYTINLTDLKMQENGAVVAYATGETPQYSALTLIHAAPSSMTLKPGQIEYVNVIFHTPDTPLPGEYRAHLQVHLVHANTEDAAAKSSAKGGIEVSTKLVVSIPIIVRVGATHATMSIVEQKLTHDASGKPAVEFYLTREGNASAMGDVAVTCATAGGKPKDIKVMAGQAVYRPLTRRFVSVPLDDLPADVNLSACQLGVVYRAQKEQGGKPLASAGIP